MAATPASGAAGTSQLYSAFKKGVKVTVGTSTKSLSGTASATDIANYIVQQFYDGDTGQGQRADLLNAIAMALDLYKGNI